jgi:hypothetical protein
LVYCDSSGVVLSDLNCNDFKTFTTPASCEYLDITRRGNTGTMSFSHIMLAEGTYTSEQLDYEPYTGGQASPNPSFESPVKVIDGEYEVTVSNSDNTQSQTQTIDTSPNPLYSENDYYYKENGEWYVHNEFKKVVLNGTEGWQYYNGIQYITTITDYQLTGLICHSSHYIGQSNVSQSSNVLDNHITFRSTSGNPNLYIKDTRFTNSSEFTTWLSNNNVTLIYKLATPKNTEITDTDLINSLEALFIRKAYQDQTNISQTHADSQADMKINAKTIMSLRYIESSKQDLITSSNKLNSDLVSDTNQTNKFVTSSEKTTWNGKLDTSKVKNANSTTAGDVYDVRYINTMIGNIESLLSEV